MSFVLRTHPAAPRPTTTSRFGGAFFVQDFDLPDPVPPSPEPEPEPEPMAPPPPSYDAAAMELACTLARGAGEAAGRAAALMEHEDAVRTSLQAIVDALADARAEAARVAESCADGIARVLMHTLGGAFPAMCARHGDVEIAAVMRRVLPSLTREPRIAITVHAAAVDGVHDRLRGYAPDLRERVAVVSDADLARGDVRIAWQDGTATRDTAALWAGIAEVLVPLGLLDAVPRASTSLDAAPLARTPQNEPDAYERKREIADVE